MKIKLILLGLAFLGTAKGGLCGAAPTSLSLHDVTTQADAVVIARLVRTTPIKQSQNNSVPGRTVRTDTIDTDLQPVAHAEFQVLQTVKGESAPAILVDLPKLRPNFYGGASFSAEISDEFLLFLHQDASQHWTLVDKTIPLVPLERGQRATISVSALVTANAEQTNKIALTSIIGVMVGSLRESRSRLADLYLLRKTVDARIPNAASPYVNDPDTRVQDNALYCLATNQIPEAIPAIQSLEGTVLQKTGGDADSIRALGAYKTPKAVAYLNPLLLADSYFLRVNAASALQNIADASSIPYLIKVLQEPDPQNVIPYCAYAALRRIISVLGPPNDVRYFEAHQQAEVQHLMDWYRANSSGATLQ